MYEVRELQAEDAEAAAALWNELVGGGLSSAALEEMERRLEAGYTRSEAVVFVAEAEGRLLGIATAHISSHPMMPGLAGEIDDLMIDDRLPDEAGDALARAAIGWLRDNGAGPVFHHRPADLPRAFWERLGFEADVVRFALYD